MKIKLEYGDGPVFTTIHHPYGASRTMLVKVGGKAFNVWRTVDPMEGEFSPDYTNEVDRVLAAAMERMLTNLFLDACAAVQEGVDLLKT